MEIADTKPFVIYKSSAGSGKTYTLAMEYVRLALQREDYFQRILAVTFTNKAAEEMKTRVLAFLQALAKGNHELLPYYAKTLDQSEQWVSERAKVVLTNILHRYSMMSISTIDTFFHKVIRNFAREIGLQGGFQIEMETNLVLDHAVDMLLEGIEPNTPLAKWLTQFARTKLTDGSSYEFRSDIKSLGKLLFTEQFKALDINLAQEVSVEDLEKLQKTLRSTQIKYENHYKALGKKGVAIMERHGLEVDDIVGKSRGIGTLFAKLDQGMPFEPKTSHAELLLNPEKWYTKKSNRSAIVRQVAENELIPLLQEIYDHYDKYERQYQSAKAINQYLYTFGILQDVSNQINRYKDEHEVIMISDLPDFLRRVVKDTDAPFIFEKFGNRYSHFLIDEFQDTSAFQWDNFRPLIENSLAENKFNMIVGDVKQSIYRFRGGDWQLLLEQVAEDIGHARIEFKNLATNYRSSPEIIAFNNDLFSSLPSIVAEFLNDSIPESIVGTDRQHLAEINAKLVLAYKEAQQEIAPSKKDQQGYVSVVFYKRESDGTSFKEEGLMYALDEVRRLQDSGFSPADIALLVRSNDEARDLVKAFLQQASAPDDGYCYDVISADAMYLTNSFITNMLISSLKYLLDRTDKISLAQIAYDYQIHVLENVNIDQHDLFGWTSLDKHLPASFASSLPILMRLPLYELVEELIRIFSLNKLDHQRAFLTGFQDAVLDYSKSHRGDLMEFMQWWEDKGQKRTIQRSGNANAIQVITVHKSKGLQFPAVIMPFCKWSMDHSTTHDNILWAAGDKSELLGVPAWLPLKYQSGLSNTSFDLSYFVERSKAFMESLNLLYVATTRAEQVLMMRCETYASESDSLNTSRLLAQYFESKGQSSTCIEFGKLPTFTSRREKAKPEKVDVMHFSAPWREKIAIREGSQNFTSEWMSLGNFVHDILARVKDYTQFESVLKELHADMELTNESMQAAKGILESMMEHPQIKQWFAPGLKVKAETAVLLPDGRTLRPDRVIFDENSVVVIDFKTGVPKSADNKQISAYKNLLLEMGYPQTTAYLVYLADTNIVKVA